MSPIPIPLTCIIRTFKYLGYIFGGKRWSSPKRLYTWDSLHGEIEMFNDRGRHLGVLDCNGMLIKDAVKGRRIDV